MKTAIFKVKCDMRNSKYIIKAQNPEYTKYDSMYTDLGSLMRATLAITNELRLKNVKARFQYEY